MVTTESLHNKYNALRQEYFENGLTTKVFSKARKFLFDELCSYIKYSYFPNYLSEENVWDENSISGLLDECLTNNKLNIKCLLDTYDNEKGFFRNAKKHFRQHILNQKKPTEKANLFRRINEILNECPEFKEFIKSPQAMNSYWGLKDWNKRPVYNLLDNDLYHEICQLSGYTLVLYKPGSEYNSPLISKKDLTKLLSDIFNTIKSPISLGQLVNVISQKLDAFQNVEFVSNDYTDSKSFDKNKFDTSLIESLPDTGISDLETLEYNELVDNIISDSEENHLRAFYGMSQSDSTLKKVASDLKVSIQTVDNYNKIIFKRIKREVENDGMDSFFKLRHLLVQRLSEMYLS